MKKTSGMTTVAFALCIALSGCSDDRVDDSKNTHQNPTALDEYVEEEAQQIEATKADFKDFYSDVGIIGESTSNINRVAATYTYLETADPSQTSMLDSAIPQVEEAMSSTIFPAMEAYGIDDVRQFSYTYLNPDGSIFWSRAFMDDGGGKVCSFELMPIQDSPTSCDDVE